MSYYSFIHDVVRRDSSLIKLLLFFDELLNLNVNNIFQFKHIGL